MLRKKHAVVRHEIYKYAVVHTSNRDKSSNAQANAQHQSSNNMAKVLVSKIAVLQVKARISAAKCIPGICGNRNALITVMQRVPGSAAEFSSPQGIIDGFPDQGNLVRKNQKTASVASLCSRGLAVS